jgi:hypothetical protein
MENAMSVIHIPAGGALYRSANLPLPRTSPLTLQEVLFPPHPNRWRSSLLIAATGRENSGVIAYFESPDSKEFDPGDCTLYRNATVQEATLIRTLLRKGIVYQSFGPLGWSLLHQKKGRSP